MFPKSQQKKKDTVVVMIEGKGPQTIPTMDTPPEAKKFPKCRLFVVLVFILLVSLILLAGYCAWLFFSYNPEAVPSDQMERPDSLAHTLSTKTTPTDDTKRLSTSAPNVKNDDVISLSTHQEADSSDFMFISSAESVYDSSEPYGNSETSYSSSFLMNVDYAYSYSYTSSVDNTKKEDQYLLEDPKGISPFERIKLLLTNMIQGDTEGTVDPSYDVMSSYWFKRGPENDSNKDDENGESSWTDVFDSDQWAYVGEGSGDWESLSFSDTTAGLIFDLFSDSYYGDFGSGFGSGDGEWDDTYDSWQPDRIPPPMTSPPDIDQMPPERIEISVCSWPSELFDQETTYVHGSTKFQFARRKFRQEYEVVGLNMNNVSITQLISDTPGASIGRTFMRDYVNSIVAVRYNVKTATASASNCYFSFLTPDLEERSLMEDYGDVIEDEMEGSGYDPEVGIREFTLEIRNPVLLGGNLPMFNDPISELCASSKKYWATSIHVKH